MIIAESKATQKRCPFTQIHCLGDNCMLWNWFDGTDDPVREGETEDEMTMKHNDRRGYCGAGSKGLPNKF
jgi:hypothetical protein